MDDRFLAYKILNKIENDKAYSNLTLESVLKNNEAVNSSFIRALVYGVLERKITLDYYLSEILSQPIKKLKPQVLTVLRMGVYQIKYMDKIPDSAAVNESVKLIKNIKCNFASGLVNSVLRKISSLEIPLPSTDNKVYDLSIKYSCPEDLVQQFLNDYGYITTEEIFNAFLQPSSLILRVNTLFTTQEALIKNLEAEGVLTEKSNINADSVKVIGGKSPFDTECYKKGHFFVQDYGSQKAIKTLELEKGDVVFDMCAAPGGKSFAMACEMKNEGEIYSFDLYDHKIKLIKDNAKRLGINIISAQLGDASEFNSDLPLADKVLCDVPCSGLGDIGRKPEIKYKDFGFIDKLCDLQYNILINATRYLKHNGVLMYSTCSLNIKENQDICEKFLKEKSEFRLVRMETVFPTKDGSDGFFFAKFIKE